MENKYCPLKATSETIAPECDGENCAWWDFILGHCAVLTIALEGAKGARLSSIEEMRAARDLGKSGQ